MQVQLKKDKPIISVPIRAVDMKQAAFSKKNMQFRCGML